jgi:Ammonium Transporter Family
VAMFMTPGLALFYGGLVRTKNVLATIMYSFAALALVTVGVVRPRGKGTDRGRRAAAGQPEGGARRTGR